MEHEGVIVTGREPPHEYPSRRVSIGLSRGGEMHVSLPGKPGEPIDERTLEALRSIGEAALNRMLDEEDTSTERSNGMSWTGSGTASEHGIAVTSLTTSPPYNDADEHVKEQMSVAADAATKIIASGAVGGPGKEYDVQVNGHANPDHEPAPGWSNDTVTVRVTQK